MTSCALTIKECHIIPCIFRLIVLVRYVLLRPCHCAPIAGLYFFFFFFFFFAAHTRSYFTNSLFSQFHGSSCSVRDVRIQRQAVTLNFTLRRFFFFFFSFSSSVYCRFKVIAWESRKDTFLRKRHDATCRKDQKQSQQRDNSEKVSRLFNLSPRQTGKISSILVSSQRVSVVSPSSPSSSSPIAVFFVVVVVVVVMTEYQQYIKKRKKNKQTNERKRKKLQKDTEKIHAIESCSPIDSRPRDWVGFVRFLRCLFSLCIILYRTQCDTTCLSTNVSCESKTWKAPYGRWTKWSFTRDVLNALAARPGTLPPSHRQKTKNLTAAFFIILSFIYSLYVSIDLFTSTYIFIYIFTTYIIYILSYFSSLSLSIDIYIIIITILPSFWNPPTLKMDFHHNKRKKKKREKKRKDRFQTTIRNNRPRSHPISFIFFNFPFIPRVPLFVFLIILILIIIIIYIYIYIYISIYFFLLYLYVFLHIYLDIYI